MLRQRSLSNIVKVNVRHKRSVSMHDKSTKKPFDFTNKNNFPYFFGGLATAVGFSLIYSSYQNYNIKRKKEMDKKELEQWMEIFNLDSKLDTTHKATISNKSTFSFSSNVNTSFNDVKGCDEVMEEMKTIVQYLKNPEEFKTIGAILPKGIIMTGPPGVGKTTIARSIAGEANVPFIYANGSEFDDTYVGVGASRMRELFDAARIVAPCVVFIDEIDTVGCKRNMRHGQTASFQTLSQLLVELDGFKGSDGIILLAATNNPSCLDPALTRPGRFDMNMAIGPPSYEGRKSLFDLFLNKVKTDTSIDLEKLASGTQSFTGASIKSMVNQAAIMAVVEGNKTVTMNHLWAARDRIIMGHCLKPIEDKDTNHTTAVHEAGHAIVSLFTKGSVPLHKVTIIPTNGSLGHTNFLDDKERHDWNREELQARIDSLLGGRIAEEIIFGENKVTTGASQDLSTANSIAKSMVMKYGMSDEETIKSIGFSENEDLSVFMKNKIDQEVGRILQNSRERVKLLLEKHKKDLNLLTKNLEDKKTLSRQEVEQLFGIEKYRHKID